MHMTSQEIEMTNDQQKLRPEDAAVSHIEPTAEKQSGQDATQPKQATPPQGGKDDKGTVELDALNP
jgi:hypothetical protein